MNINLLRPLCLQIAYSVSPVQLTLLRLIYSKANQTLTYHCKNSYGFRDRKGRTGRALTLVGPNGVRISPDNLKADLKYDVNEDGCQVSQPGGDVNWDCLQVGGLR